ncbi:MAG: sulfur carrier protein ThiS [Bacteroidia bacterium]
MTVFINNTSCLIDADASLSSALQQQGLLTQKGIAVAVNNTVIPKADWQQKVLNDQDKITIIRATQGG